MRADRPITPRGTELAAGPLARFPRHDGGATAVEFGFVALPFLFLLFAILEVAMVFWTTQALETATAAAARKIYTGQFQSDPANANLTSQQLATKFKQELCNNLPALVGNCATTVSVDVRNYSTSFAGASATSPVVNGAYDTSGFAYQTIGPKQIAVVTAALKYPTFVPMLRTTGGLSDGSRVVMATATFRSEPYAF